MAIGVEGPVPVTQTLLSRLAVVQPVSFLAIPQRWINDLDFLNSYVMRSVTSQVGFPNQVSLPCSYPFLYRKTPGAQLLAVSVDPHLGSSASSSGFCTLSATSGTITFGASPDNQLDGAHPISVSNIISRSVLPAIIFVDVSALTNGTVYTFTLSWQDISGSKGLYGFNVIEMAVGDVDPVYAPTTELGADMRAFFPRAPIVDGSATVADGFQRMLQQLEIARYQNYLQGMQLCLPEDTTNAFQMSTYGTNDVMNFVTPGRSGINAPTLRMRTRNLYATTNARRLYVRYLNTPGSTQQGTIGVKMTGVGGASSYVTRLLPHVETWTLDSGLTLAMPTSGTGQEVDVQLLGWLKVTAGSCYVSLIAIIEDEV